MSTLWRGFVVAFVLAGTFVVHASRPASAAGVVGNGTPGSCSEAALDTALSGGGLVTFNCDAGDLPIVLTNEKMINADTRIEGGGVTLSTDGNNRHFTVNNGFTLELEGITLRDGNVGGNSGGAIVNYGTLLISNSTLTSNVAGNLGGAIVNDGGTLEIAGSTLAENNGGLGGGIYIAEGIVTITSSTLNDNDAGNAGGGIYASTGTLELTSSTLSGNSALNGGGVFVLVATVTLTNSTLSGNSVGARGGGFQNAIGSMTVSNTTITNNISTSDVAGAYQSDGSLTFQNTIIANNGFLSCFNVSVPTSLGGNLTDDDTSCTTAFNQPTDLYVDDALLGPLADNGGPTLTHLPQTGSPVIDNGLNGGCPAEDQRGVSRPRGSACDIGAVEVSGGATFGLCVSFYTGAVTSPLSGSCGAGTVAIEPYGQTFCINPWTGRLTFSSSGTCAPPRFAHTLPDDGDLLTCVSLYTGANRWVTHHSQCTPYELPNTISALP